MLMIKRARKWENKMDELSNRRNELANDLTETMSEIESQSGIFLIKPLFSYKSLLVNIDVCLHMYYDIFYKLFCNSYHCFETIFICRS